MPEQNEQRLGFEKRLDALLQFKRGTVEKLEESQEIFEPGEPIVGINAYGSILKIGDGEHTWSELPFLNTASTGNSWFYDLTDSTVIDSINDALSEKVDETTINTIKTTGIDLTILNILENKKFILPGHIYKIKYNYQSIPIRESAREATTKEEIAYDPNTANNSYITVDPEEQAYEDSLEHIGNLEFLGNLQIITTTTNKRYTRVKTNGNWETFILTSPSAEQIKTSFGIIGDYIVQAIETEDEFNRKLDSLNGSIQEIQRTIPNKEVLNAYIERTAAGEVKRYTQQNLNSISEKQTEIEISVDGVRSTVDEVIADMGEYKSQIDQTAELISARVEQVDTELSAELDIALEEIDSKVSNADVQSLLSQTAEGLEFKIQNSEEKLLTQLSHTQDALNVQFNDLESRYTSNFNLTKEQLTTQFNDFKENVQSKLDITAQGLDYKVSDLEDKMSSQISIAKNQILTEVKDENSDLYSKISQTAGQLEGVVSSLDGMTKASIQAYIEDEISHIKLSAEDITLEGAVSANEHFKINTDGSMTVDQGTIGGWTISNGVLSAKISGTSITGYETFDSKNTHKKCLRTDLYLGAESGVGVELVSLPNPEQIPNDQSNNNFNGGPTLYAIYVTAAFPSYGTNYMVYGKNYNDGTNHYSSGGVYKAYPVIVRLTGTGSRKFNCLGCIYNNRPYIIDSRGALVGTNGKTTGATSQIEAAVYSNAISYSSFSTFDFEMPVDLMDADYNGERDDSKRIIAVTTQTIGGNGTYIKAYSLNDLTRYQQPVIALGVPNTTTSDLRTGTIGLYADGTIKAKQIYLNDKTLEQYISAIVETRIKTIQQSS